MRAAAEEWQGVEPSPATGCEGLFQLSLGVGGLGVLLGYAASTPRHPATYTRRRRPTSCPRELLRQSPSRKRRRM
jgi:hypothetical protein